MNALSLAVLAMACVANAEGPALESAARNIHRAPPRFVRTAAAIKGRADAPMTLTLFGNFACPNTARLVRYGVVDELLRRHPTTLRLEFRHFSKPHPEGVPAALRWDAVRRVAPASAWAYFDGLFDCRLAKDLTPSCMARLESRLGLDSAALDAAAARYAPEARTAQQSDDSGAASASVNGTPTLLLDGHLLIDGAPGPGCAAGDDACAAALAQAFKTFTDTLDSDIQEHERALGLPR